MKPISLAFLAAELADFVTTLAGLTLPQVREINPVGLCTGVLIAKVIVMLFGYLILQRTRVRFAWVVPTIAILPVIWNVLIIISETIGINI